MDDSSYPLVTRLVLNYSRCGVSQSILNNETYQALQCVAGQSISGIGTSCIVCPNSDIASVGVRAAFYITKVFSIVGIGLYIQPDNILIPVCLALLVILSPEDAAASAWAGAVLTAGLLIAAFVQKAASPPSLTLHHATLILKFVCAVFLQQRF